MIRLLALCLVLTATTAHAQSHLSDRGRILIAGELGGWWQNHDDWHIGIGPQAAYFLRDHIGLGGYFTYTNAREGALALRSRSYQFGVTSMNELPLAERLSVWANVRVGYVRYDDDTLPPFNLFPNATDQLVDAGSFSPFVWRSRNWVHFGLFLPFVYQVNDHVGVGIGPDVGIHWSPSIEKVDAQIGMKTWIPISI